MLTLQNDPPTLDSVAEEKDQYKNYGKSIRKMIAECLQKDPSKRPTATELLKHPFFKKAKDKKYLVQTCLSCAPSIEERAKKVKTTKRPPGTSGRLHRTETGEWEWSDDDSSDNASKEPTKKKLSDVQQIKPNSSSSTSNNQPVLEDKLKNLNLDGDSMNKSQQQSNQVPLNNNNENGSQGKINFVLRIRNSRKALNDIKFEFLVDIGKNEIILNNWS